MKPSQEPSVDRLLRARAEIDAALRQHKTAVTILFSDVVGSTTYFERYGDTAGFAMLQRQGELCTGIIGEHGGTVIKTIGDSVMAEFSSAAAGVRAAVTIQRQLLTLNEALTDRERVRLRIGIHMGMAFRRENDVFGDAVNLAARITKRTGPAQILVSRAVQEAVDGQADTSSVWLGKVALEGRSEKEDVFEIVWTDPDTYRELRKSVTLALARGDLASPGLRLDDLVQAASAEGSAGALPVSTSIAPGSVTPQPPVTLLPERYEVLGEAGRGGMGIVYKARDRETGELVAIKLLMPNIASDEKMIERFKNELRLARKITHKYVCRIYDLYRAGDTAFISMEFVEGESLRGALNRFGTLSLRKAIQIGQQICQGLQEAHAQGIVHRDLKPENVILDGRGNVKLMDFGIARSVEISPASSDLIFGTPAYMSPEQAEGKQVDLRSDIYALGLVLYEALTGIPAFVGETPIAVAIKQIQEAPTPPRLLEPSIPPHIEALVLRCLEKDPALRFTSAAELGEVLCASPPAGARERTEEKRPEGPLRVAAAVVLMALLGGVFWIGRASKVVPTAARQASLTGVAVQPDSRSDVATPVTSVGTSRGEASTPADAKGGALRGNDPVATQTVARNPKELEQLTRQNNQVRFYKLNLPESIVFTKVGPALVRVSKASEKKQLYTLVFRTHEHVVDMKDRTLYEPIRFYDAATRRTLEVVAYKIEDGRILGYLSDPGPATNGPPIPVAGEKPATPQDTPRKPRR